jgi:hypothetical protein
VPSTCHHTETLLIRMRMPKVLAVPATGLIGFSREWRRIALHLGDMSRGLDPDRLVRVPFVVHMIIPIVVAVKIESAQATCDLHATLYVAASRWRYVTACHVEYVTM